MTVISGIPTIPDIPKVIFLHLFIFAAIVFDIECALITLALILPKTIVIFLKNYLTVPMAFGKPDPAMAFEKSVKMVTSIGVTAVGSCQAGLKIT